MVPKLNSEVLKLEAEQIAEELKKWTWKFEEAKKQVEYWKRQQDALSTVSVRYIFGDGGVNQSVKEETHEWRGNFTEFKKILRGMPGEPKKDSRSATEWKKNYQEFLNSGQTIGNWLRCKGAETHID